MSEDNIPHINQFSLEAFQQVVEALSLNSVTIGDYLVIMNSAADIIILGEPYLALQLWFHMKSGMFMGRVWSQSVSNGKVENIAQLTEACTSLFQCRPCLGYPLHGEKVSLQGKFLISQTPLPRMMSNQCKKIIDKEENITRCTECLNIKLKVETEPGQDDFDTYSEGCQDETDEKMPVKVQILEEDEKKEVNNAFQQKLNDLRICYHKKREEIMTLSRETKI